MLDDHAVDLRVPFVGRAHELQELFAFLKRGGIVTLVGPGGVGKTRLMHEAIARFAERQQVESVFVPLAGIAPEAVVGTVMTALGIGEESGRLALQTIVERMRDRVLILALDNCEHAPDEVAALIDALRVLPGITIVATSQRRLDYTDETVFDVEPFTIEDGRAFFLARAGIEPGAITVETISKVTNIVERVDGLAVALDLAAARLASLSLAELAEELLELRPYQLRSTRGSEPRHRTIGNVIAWAHGHLSDTAKTAFAQASLFAREFDADDMSALGELQRDQIEAALAELVDNSLVLRTENGYRMLLPIRAVAARMLSTMRNRRALDERFALRINALANQLRAELTAPNQTGRAISRIHARYADFCTALAWALKRPQERMSAVADIPTAAMLIWAESGRFAEGLRWMERLENAVAKLDPEIRGRIYYLGLVVANAAAEYHRMVENGPLTISAFTIAGDRLGLARAYNALAAASLNTGRIEDATTYVETSLRFYEQLGHERGIASALVNRGNIFFDGLGDPARARETFSRAAALLENGTPNVLSGIAIGDLAEVDYALGDYESCRVNAARAIDHFEASSSSPMIAWQYETLARCEAACGNAKVATDHLLVASDLLRRTPQPLYVARLAEVAARVLLARGKPERAAQLLAAARRYRAERAIVPLGLFAAEARADEAAARQALGSGAFEFAAKSVVNWDLSRLAEAAGDLLAAGDEK